MHYSNLLNTDRPGQKEKLTKTIPRKTAQQEVLP